VTRSQSSANGKRKRSASPPPPKVAFERTPLTYLYVQGLDRDQIWAQLELRTQSICKMLEFALDGTEDAAENGITSTTNNLEQDPQQEDEDDDDDDDDSTFEGSDDESEPDQEPDGSSDGQPEGVIGLRDHSMDEEDEELTGGSPVPSSVSPSRMTGGHIGLNDDFFDLEEFNAETEEAEAGFVSNGALDADLDDIDSDEDDIDYFASVDGQAQANDDHGRPIAHSAITPIAKYWSF